MRHPNHRYRTRMLLFASVQDESQENHWTRRTPCRVPERPAPGSGNMDTQEEVRQRPTLHREGPITSCRILAGKRGNEVTVEHTLLALRYALTLKAPDTQWEVGYQGDGTYLIVGIVDGDFFS